MVSPYVQRNLDHAQYEQARGSQYAGPDLGQHPDPIREMQDESIHREELAFARIKNAHYAHYVLEGVLVNDCHFCMDLVG